jgi:N-acetylated-alpha-linked acidic dipeptidase
VLAKAGIEVKGKIAIARYGKIFRGTKAMIAQEYGMVGIVIYSDPADDGYAQGPVYPEVSPNDG